MWQNLWEGCQGLHPSGRWWEDLLMYRWIQWHLPTQWRKCGFLHPGGTTQCVQLRPKLGVAGKSQIFFSATVNYIPSNVAQYNSVVSCKVTWACQAVISTAHQPPLLPSICTRFSMLRTNRWNSFKFSKLPNLNLCKQWLPLMKPAEGCAELMAASWEQVRGGMDDVNQRSCKKSTYHSQSFKILHHVYV